MVAARTNTIKENRVGSVSMNTVKNVQYTFGLFLVLVQVIGIWAHRATHRNLQPTTNQPTYTSLLQYVYTKPLKLSYLEFLLGASSLIGERLGNHQSSSSEISSREGVSAIRVAKSFLAGLGYLECRLCSGSKRLASKDILQKGMVSERTELRLAEKPHSKVLGW